MSHSPEADICPECGSPEIEGGFVEIEGNNSIQDCSCVACGARYHLVFALVDVVLHKDCASDHMEVRSDNRNDQQK
jgi:hypothetical protein